MSNEDKFSGKADHYKNARSAYADELLDLLYSRLGFTAKSRIADVGSGTGIFSEQLLKRGSKVFCVEPNADMRKASEAQLGDCAGFVSVDGNDENTTLPDSSVDIVTVAQALHWFKTDEFRRECKRILTPNGTVVIVYNYRRDDLLNQKLNAVIARRCPKSAISSGPTFIEANTKKIDALFYGKYDFYRAANPIFMDKTKFIDYWLSRSYAPRKGDAEYEPFLCDIIEIFTEYANGDLITLNQDTVAYIGKAI